MSGARNRQTVRHSLAAGGLKVTGAVTTTRCDNTALQSPANNMLEGNGMTEASFRCRSSQLQSRAPQLFR